MRGSLERSMGYGELKKGAAVAATAVGGGGGY